MNTRTMTRKKKELSSNRQLAQAIIDQYQPQSVEDMQDALKDILGPMFEAMLQGEMNSHLGYSSNERRARIEETVIQKRHEKQELAMSPLKFHVIGTELLNRRLYRKESEMSQTFRIKYFPCTRKE